MKRKLSAAALVLALFAVLPVQARAAQLLIPVGDLIGLQLRDDTVTVAAYDDILGARAMEAGLKIGDEILKIDERNVTCAEDIRGALRSSQQVELTVRRGSKTARITMTPEQTEEGPRLGVHLRQGIAGIGTVTFFDPETGKFGTLGHGVSDSRGTLLKMTQGYAYRAEVLSVKKGRSGDPGQLKGSAESGEILGNLMKNTPQGVFGVTSRGWKGEPLPVAAYEEVQTGEAAIRCTVGGRDTQEYSVEILRIYPQSRTDCRNFLLRITDPVLLETTGGIVQGMSGSPIIQNGRLVGAVTHVLVNDPTCGYGIFIENMLEAAA